MINNKDLEAYLRSLLPPRDQLLVDLELDAKTREVPIVQPEVAKLLETLLAIHQSRQVLEIGTAIGYSTIILARGVQSQDGHVTTIESRLPSQQRALANFRRAGLSEQITSLMGDALELIPAELGHLKGGFDFIFIDAAKGQYLNFYKLCLPLLAPGGLLVADNVLFKGWVVPGSTFPRRQKTSVNRLRQLLQDLCHHPSFNTTLLPIGDGVLVAYQHNQH